MSLITFTAGLGSEGITVARGVAERLSVDLYDDERLRMECLAMGLTLPDQASISEKAPGFFSRLLDLKPDTYHELLEAVILHVARRGTGVIIGHGSSFLLRDFGCALHIRIHSTERRRIERIAREWKVDEAAARKAVRKSDSDHRRFMEYAFQIGRENSDLYDLIVNIDKLGTPSAIEMIVSVASSPAVSSCSLTALETMGRYSLEKRIEAVLKQTAMNPRAVQISLSNDGDVTLSGVMNPLESRDRLIEAVRAVPGVRSVRDAIFHEPIHDL